MILDIDPVAEKDKRDAALSSVTGAVFLTGLKLTVGILAEAIHAQVAGLSQVLIHVEPGGVGRLPAARQMAANDLTNAESCGIFCAAFGGVV